MKKLNSRMEMPEKRVSEIEDKQKSDKKKLSNMNNREKEKRLEKKN